MRTAALRIIIAAGGKLIAVRSRIAAHPVRKFMAMSQRHATSMRISSVELAVPGRYEKPAARECRDGHSVLTGWSRSGYGVVTEQLSRASGGRTQHDRDEE